MPLATSKTRPQVQSFLDRLRKHESAAALPYSAWRTVDTLGISLGNLNSHSSDQLRAFCENLKTFNAASILGTELGDGLPITLKGLSSGPGMRRAFTNILRADVADPQPIAILRNELDKLLKSHGLRHPANQGLSDINSISISVKIMHTKNLISDIPLWKRASSSASRYFMQPVFDARELYAAHEDTTWVENLPLDSICLHNLAALSNVVKNGTIIGQGYEDIFRISLSDPAESAYGGPDPDAEYVSRNPKTPFIISSDPRAKETYLELYPAVRLFR